MPSSSTARLTVRVVTLTTPRLPARQFRRRSPLDDRSGRPPAAGRRGRHIGAPSWCLSVVAGLAIWKRVWNHGEVALPQERSAWSTVLFVVLLLSLAAAIVFAFNRSQWETRQVQAVIARSDTASLQVVIAHSSCPGDGVRAHVTKETRDLVQLRAEHGISGDCDDIGLTTTVSLELDAPLGGRVIRVVQPAWTVDTEQVMDCRIDEADSDRCRITRG